MVSTGGIPLPVAIARRLTIGNITGLEEVPLGGLILRRVVLQPSQRVSSDGPPQGGF